MFSAASASSLSGIGPADPNQASLKPPLKWAGGKRWLLPHIQPLWQPYSKRRLVEPFCGGLAIPLGLKPTTALLNDVNPHLLNFYRQLQQGLKVTVAMKNTKLRFYQHRRRFNQLVKNHKWQTAEAAQLFYYLNRTGFNGLCRFNKAGEFNVPFGTHSAISYATDFSEYQTAFKNWVFSNEDFESLKIQRDDFIYADPPYDVEFTSYSSGGFDWQDQVRTAEWLKRHRGPVVVSNQATPRIVDLYSQHGFTITYLAGPRRISCTGDRSAAKEILATKGI